MAGKKKKGGKKKKKGDGEEEDPIAVFHTLYKKKYCVNNGVSYSKAIK